MDDLVRKRLPGDLRQAARIMAEMGAFETGQSLMSDAAEEIERLRAALRPFSAGVFNDNGELTISRPNFTLEDVERAYWALRSTQEERS